MVLGGHPAKLNENFTLGKFFGGYCRSICGLYPKPMLEFTNSCLELTGDLRRGKGQR